MKNGNRTPHVGLVRALGPLMATAVVVGTTVGSGVFKKPQIVSANLPYFGLAALVWILGGLLALMGSLAYAEIAILYPKAGGNYVFLREGYGRLAGFLWGWVEFCIIRSASIAALATIFAESLHDVLRNEAFQRFLGVNWGAHPVDFWGQRWLTIGVIMALAFVNVLGVRRGGALQLFITLIKIGSLIAIALLPFMAWRLIHSDAAVPSPNVENLTPLWPASADFGVEFSWQFPRILSLGRGYARLGAALLAVIWAYHGWMNIAPVAQEVRNPRRNIPISLLSGVVIIITLYLGANLGYYLIIPQAEIAAVPGDTNVATVFSLRLLGPIGAAAASAAVMCSVFGALNGNLLVGPRLLYAMGEDGVAPRSLANVHPRFRTPVQAILVMAVWSCLLVLGGGALIQYRLPVLTLGSWMLDVNPPEGKALFDLMTDFAMFAAIIFETSAVCTIFVFRWRYPNADRPYRCIGYPIVPALYAIIFFLIAANTFVNQPTESLAVLTFVAVGIVVYFVFARGNTAFIARHAPSKE